MWSSTQSIFVLSSLLCALPTVASGAERTPRQPTSVERRAALDDFQRALGDWQAQRREHNREVARQDAIRRARVRRAEEARSAGLDGDGQGTKATARARKGRELGKVIEVGPRGEQRVVGAESDDLEQQVLRNELELEERARWCRENPEECAREKEKRRLIREGNRAWDEIVEAKRLAREQAIEAEARKIQAALDAARRREALQRAKELGGTLDADGNFVDGDLESERAADRKAKD